MRDSQLNGAERRWQRMFILALLLPVLAVLEGSAVDDRPDRTPAPPSLAPVRLTPLPLPPRSEALPVGALWTLSSPEPRFGGLSGLAVDGASLLAISDSGTAVRWPKVGGVGAFRDLPAGPGKPEWKRNRDAEALVRDPAGRGWWVFFEQFHSAWLFDWGFSRALERRDVPLRTWWRNWGIEGAAFAGETLLLLPENGGRIVDGRHGTSSPLRAPAQIADAATLTDGRIVVALRSARPWGVVNRVGWLRRTGSGYAVEAFGTLPLGRWDNVEGLAPEAMPDGTTRLWFVTDNDFSRRTLLGWVTLPPR